MRVNLPYRRYLAIIGLIYFAHLAAITITIFLQRGNYKTEFLNHKIIGANLDASTEFKEVVWAATVANKSGQKTDTNQLIERAVNAYTKTKIRWFKYNKKPTSLLMWPLKACEYYRMEALLPFTNMVIRVVDHMDQRIPIVGELEDKFALAYWKYYELDRDSQHVSGACERVRIATVKIAALIESDA